MYLRDAVKFVKPALIKFEVTWSVYGLFKPYHSKIFKVCLSQILIDPLLKKLFHMIFNANVFLGPLRNFSSNYF